MKIEIGDFIMVETKTVGDSFGNVLYRVEEVGLDVLGGENDGVSLRMLGGSGRLARPGIKIIDNVRSLTLLFANGRAEFVDKGRGDALTKKYSDESGGLFRTGVIEF